MDETLNIKFAPPELAFVEMRPADVERVGKLHLGSNNFELVEFCADAKSGHLFSDGLFCR
jgi:hypothetical protein